MPIQSVVRKRNHPAAVTLGRLGGLVRSEAKAAASRRNGRLGGRPRKADGPRNGGQDVKGGRS